MEANNDAAFAEVTLDPHYRLLVRMPVLPPANEASSGNSWQARSQRGRALRRDFAVLVPDWKRPDQPLNEAAVTFTRFSQRRPDYGNLVRGFKLVEDCLHARSLGRRPIVQDDNHEVIGQPRYLWEPTLPGRGYIEIIVEDRAPWVVTFR